MANRLLLELTATSTVLVLLVLLQAALVWEWGNAAPAKRSDILAGTEFLSVFINGAMATPPQRRRGQLKRVGQALNDHVAAESQQQDASVYRISRTSNARPAISNSHKLPREEGARFYPISQKSLENSENLASLIDELGTASEISAKLSPQTEASAASRGSPATSNGTSEKSNKSVNQKVIGVSVTSTVEATPYKVRVEHYDSDEITVVSRPPVVPTGPSATTRSTAFGTRTTITTTTAPTRFNPAIVTSQSTTPLPPLLITEELSNIVSESNRSEFSVDEGSPKTSWHARGRITARPMIERTASASRSRHRKKETAEENYEVAERNSETREVHVEPAELPEQPHQGRKVGRHYDSTSYNQPSRVYGQPAKVYSKPARIYGEPAKVYSEPAKIYSEPEKIYSEPSKVYSEPAKVYSEPAKVYSEPAKVYSEPAKIYSQPEKIYSEPSKVYSEPAKVYSEPAKIYSKPAKVYGEPSKVYGSDGQPVEPEEENYEIDEAVSVGSNGNAHGPQIITETPSNDPEDPGHKVGYVVEGRNYRKYRVEERTPDGFIVGEYGVVSHDDGSLRGVRYTADGTINPRLIYDALMKFLAL